MGPVSLSEHHRTAIIQKESDTLVVWNSTAESSWAPAGCISGGAGQRTVEMVLLRATGCCAGDKPLCHEVLCAWQ